MMRATHRIRPALPLLWLTLAVCHSGNAQDGHARTRVAFANELPRLDGSRLEATLVEVSYGPGESSPPHSHPCPVIGYVIEGTLRSQVKGERETVYTAGQSFYEAPNSVHQVSANASREKPARFLAYFVCDREGPLSVPVPPSQNSKGRQ